MTDTTDAARILRDAASILRQYQYIPSNADGAPYAEAANRLEQVATFFDPPAPPAPKRLGLATDETIGKMVKWLRATSFRPGDECADIADFLDAARMLAAEVPDDLTAVRRLRDSFATGSISHDYWDAIYRVLARLAGLPATEEPNG